MRVAAVIGGSGFLGRYVVRALCRAGVRVRIGVRNPERALFLKPMGELGQVAPVRMRLVDPASIEAVVEGADIVVNLAGILYERGRQTFQAVHVEGARRIAEAAAASGVDRFVHVSALGADAASPARYARSKAAGEAAVSAAFPGATIVRPSIVFGVEDDFYNRFAWLARLSPILPLIGGGGTRFQPVHAADVAAGIMRILDKDETRGRLYEFGGPTTYSFAEILAYILEQTERRRLLVPVPAPLALVKAFFLELSPFPPLLTRDQVRMLAVDNVTGAAPGLSELGVAPVAVEAIAPSYLGRYRRGGRQKRALQG